MTTTAAKIKRVYNSWEQPVPRKAVAASSSSLADLFASIPNESTAPVCSTSPEESCSPSSASSISSSTSQQQQGVNSLSHDISSESASSATSASSGNLDRKVKTGSDVVGIVNSDTYLVKTTASFAGETIEYYSLFIIHVY